ncbi:hypothetical protein AN958_03431 [Leucoagaricus sp. SymC.cos]|nr:hypothetical protein AN958_03431 [Leucoagaricus sp. SymC.cos]
MEYSTTALKDGSVLMLGYTVGLRCIMYSEFGLGASGLEVLLEIPSGIFASPVRVQDLDAGAELSFAPCLVVFVPSKMSDFFPRNSIRSPYIGMHFLPKRFSSLSPSIFCNWKSSHFCKCARLAEEIIGSILLESQSSDKAITDQFLCSSGSDVTETLMQHPQAHSHSWEFQQRVPLLYHG